jgi:hypothetical protein
VIICDLMLPSIDGRGVLDAIQRFPELRRVPFLILSGVRSEATIRATLDAGAHAFLLKPYPVSQLVETIRKVLEETPRQEPGPERAEAVGSIGGTFEVDRDQELGLLPPGSLALPVARVPPQKRRTEPDRHAPPPAGGGAASLPLDEGRISRLELDGTRVEVKTGAVSGQNLVILTTVSRDGKELWKAETTWSRLLREDAESLKKLINHQHAGAVEEVRRLPSEARPPVQEHVVEALPANVTQPLHPRGPDRDVGLPPTRESDRIPGDPARSPASESNRTDAPGKARPGKRRGKQAPPPPIVPDAPHGALPPPVAPDAAQKAPHAPIALDGVELQRTGSTVEPSLPEPAPPADSLRPQGWLHLLWEHAFRAIGVLLA